jgi:hypothetical protein
MRVNILYVQCTCRYKHPHNTLPLKNPSFCPFLCLFPTLLWIQLPFFYLLRDPSFGDRGANIHPLLSLVGDQMPTPCFLTLTEDTPWLTLHVYIDAITTSATLSDTVM